MNRRLTPTVVLAGVLAGLALSSTPAAFADDPGPGECIMLFKEEGAEGICVDIESIGLPDTSQLAEGLPPIGTGVGAIEIRRPG